MPWPICYTIGFLLYFVICSPMHDSSTFTLRPFYFPRISLFVVPAVHSSIRHPTLPVHSPWAPRTCFPVRLIYRAFPVSSLLDFPCIYSGFPNIFSSPILRALCRRIVQFISDPRAFGGSFLEFFVPLSLCFPIYFLMVPGGPCSIRRAFLVCNTASFVCHVPLLCFLYITLQVSCSFHVLFSFAF